MLCIYYSYCHFFCFFKTIFIITIIMIKLLSRSTIVHLLSSTSALIRSHGSARLCKAAADPAHQCHKRGARVPGVLVQDIFATPMGWGSTNGSTHQPLRMKITPDVSASTEPAPETHGTPGSPGSPGREVEISGTQPERSSETFASERTSRFGNIKNNSEQLTSRHHDIHQDMHEDIRQAQGPLRTQPIHFDFLIFRGPCCTFRAVLLEKLRLQVDEALAVKLAPQSGFPHLQLWSGFCNRFCHVFSMVSAVVSSFCGICRFRSDFIDFWWFLYLPRLSRGSFVASLAAVCRTWFSKPGKRSCSCRCFAWASTSKKLRDAQMPKCQTPPCFF